MLCFWTQTITGGPGTYSHRVLPDACVDIVFINDSPPILVGPWCASFIADLPRGTQILGVRFHPGRAPDLLAVPGFELRDLSLPLRDVCGRSVLMQFVRVQDQSSLPAKKAVLEMLMSRWLSSSTPSDRVVRSAIRLLAQHPCTQIDQLCQDMGISTRQLHRRFAASVGYGPKLFQSVLRFQRLLHLAGRSPAGLGLARLAAEAGYADQSHMTRDVLRFSGLPPSALLGCAQCTLDLSELLGASDALA